MQAPLAMPDPVTSVRRAPHPAVRCRAIESADHDALVALLDRGFPDQGRAHWERAFARLAAHRTPPGTPVFGYLLEAAGAPVGVILTIFSEIPCAEGAMQRVNLASWYVEPAYRGFANLLSARALAHPGVCAINITPAPHTWPLLEAQGWRRYAQGQVLAFAALVPGPLGARVREFADGGASCEALAPAERALLRDHAAYGCLSVVVRDTAGHHPFVFARRVSARRVPYAVLAWCRAPQDFERLAGPLGRWLLLRGMPVVVVDANGPLRGVPGRYVDGQPKYFKGASAPRLGDLAYTERVMFGL